MKIKFKKTIHEGEKINNDEIIEILLKNRNIKDKDEFLNPPHPKDIPFEEFFPKKEFAKLIKKLKEIKEKDQMIVVYTDYDADGITGGAILWETLYFLGFKVMPYVPHRKNEGYGFSKKGINTVKSLYNPALIISVDHGICSADKITYAKKLGIFIIISDHHLKSNQKPSDALAVFHTEKLSGAGVAYFLAKEIFKNFKITNSTLENNFNQDYLALASIGVIADLVPLIGSSRSIVKYGLEAFKNIKRIGIKQILEEASIEKREITPYEIGFIIAPRINAVGRLGHAIDALRLLCTTRWQRAQGLAGKLGQKNKERQDMLKIAVGEAIEKVQTRLDQDKSLPKIVILSSEKWDEGIIGLIAAKITEEFYRPSIVITKSDGFAKASGRSIPGFDLTSFLRAQKKYLLDIGGHKMACGFTLEKTKIADFTTKIEKEADKILQEADLERMIEVDVGLPLSVINLSLVKKIERLYPFGIKNPQPAFYSEAKLISMQIFGKDKTHLKIYLKQDSSSFPLEIIFFGQAKQFFKLSKGEKVGVVYNLEIDRWGGREKLRGKGKLIKPM